ncbi:pyrophosphatase PpaX [Halalkalibacter sp. APA_J-10(15)]|uniref:pyrophosphatase PpaX n=1 Tax=Halalkalibacter sp. APA_J-10(15) TaxID=2933805 RepID=UPI001FF0E698|nr:pyrophosphatase PpaX [Halalkalibacter sp. APA_J-10(15)]MCK0472990.1 pyrophosphatase PpaX [Halalkalibacter sp. APA_J-10(15)]
MPTIDTILFDLDGTLINTNDLIIESFLHTLDHFHPGEYNREKVIEFIGPPLVDSFQSVDPGRVDEMVTHYREFNHRMHDELVTEYVGVYETIERLHKQGYKLAIVTTKIRKTAMMGLQLMKLDQFFDVVIGLDDVKHAKPHPEPLEKALEQLGSKKKSSMMVGDSHSDILSGKNLGIPTVAVAWSIKGMDKVKSFGADYIIDEMAELLPIVGADHK